MARKFIISKLFSNFCVVATLLTVIPNCVTSFQGTTTSKLTSNHIRRTLSPCYHVVKKKPSYYWNSKVPSTPCNKFLNVPIRNNFQHGSGIIAGWMKPLGTQEMMEISTTKERENNNNVVKNSSTSQFMEDQTKNMIYDATKIWTNDNEVTKEERQEEVEPYTRILLLCWFVAVLSALDRVAMSVAILPIATEFHLTETLKGEISSVFSLGYGISIIPFGLMVAAFSPTVIMGLGVALWSLATIGTPIAASMTNILEIPSPDAEIVTYITENIAPLLLARIIMGASESVVLPAIQRILANWVPLDRKSSAVATVLSGFQVGTVCAYLLSPIIMDNYGGWRGMFYIYGVVGLLWLIPWTLLARDYPSELQISSDANLNSENSVLQQKEVENHSTNEDEIESNNLNEALSMFRNAPWKSLAQSKGVQGMAIAHAASNWGLYNSLAWTPTFYTEQYNLNVRDSAFLSILPSLAGAVGGLLAGNLADSILRNIDNDDESQIKRTRIRKTFQGIALLGPAACLLTLANHTPEQPIVAQALLTGVVGLQAFNAAGFGAATQEKADRWSGLLYSITSLPGVMFGSLGVYITGQILDATGHDWSGVFYINAMVNVIGATAFIKLYDSNREFE